MHISNCIFWLCRSLNNFCIYWTALAYTFEDTIQGLNMRREAAVLTRRSLYQQKDPRLKDVSTPCGNSMIAHTRKSIIGPSVLQRRIITLHM